EESIRYLFNVEVQVSQPAVPEALQGVKDARGIVGQPVIKTPGLEAPEQPASLQFSAPNSQGQVETRVERTAAAKPAQQPSSRKDSRQASKKKRRK
ncbi:MAG: preprotein translocase subunit SecA, partial [Arthrobacter sp.]